MGLKRAMMLGLDGADPVVVKRMIEAGRLPNLAKLLKEGVAHDSLGMLGVFPTVTPPNWATLATGCYPRTHGVTCFLNHTLGKSLGITEMNWDSRRIHAELVWEAFADEGKRSILLNYCEAWPPRIESDKTVIVDGTGVVPFLRSSIEFQKLVYMDKSYPSMKDVPHTVSQSSGDCVVFNDQVQEFGKADVEMSKEDLLAAMSGSHFQTLPLESEAFVLYGLSAEEAANADVIDRLYTPLKVADKWAFEVPENALEATVTLNQALARRVLLITASNGVTYDTVTLYPNKKEDKPMATVKIDQWSGAIFDTFTKDDAPRKVAYYIKLVDLNSDKGRLYISHIMDVEDDTYYYPQSLQKEMMDAVGPMCYFANFDRHTAVGDEVTLESFQLLHQWHVDATHWLFNKYPDWQLFYIHLHSIDLFNHWYIEESIPGSHPDWERHAELINRIYEVNDLYIGEMMKHLDGDTTIFVMADHAAIPRSVGYENPGIGELSGINAKVMSDLGYTVVNPVPGIEGMYTIDWTKTRAINHRTSHIYINLKGRDPDGIVEPEDYDDLVQQIISDLYSYRDPKSGDRVVSFAMTREEMECVGMGGEHCGDIFFQLTRDFGFQHASTPNHVTNHGYSVGCLCMMGGAGLKSGEILTRPIRNVDIVPTICEVVGNRMPKQVEGGVIYQALAE